MSQSIQNSMTDEGATHSQWKSLYRVGGVTALIATALFFSDVIVLTTGAALPNSASEWFTLMQKNKTLGLLELYFTDLVGLTLLIPSILALYALLRQVNTVYSALAAVSAFMGLGGVFAANPNYSLVYLSNQYTNAATELQRSQILTAAESVFATGMWGTGYLMAGFLVEGALVIFSVLMLRSSAFGKGIAYLGILAHGLDVLHSITVLVLTLVFNPARASSIGSPLLAIGGTLQLFWYPLMARKLLQSGGAPRKNGRIDFSHTQLQSGQAVDELYHFRNFKME